MSYSVGQVAALAGVTVRTLHHYDEIGLLTPGDLHWPAIAATATTTCSDCGRSCSTASSGSPSTRSRTSSTTRTPTPPRICAASTNC